MSLARMGVAVREQEGMLLFECVLVVVITTLLLSAVLPGVQAWVREQRMRHVSSQLRALLYRARLAAMRRHHSVRCCGSSDGRRCDGAWSEGWLLQAGSSPLFYQRVHFPSLHWRAGCLHQVSGIVLAPTGRLASSPGHFEWVSGGGRQRLSVGRSGVFSKSEPA